MFFYKIISDGHAISLKWTGIAWGAICLAYIVAFKVNYLYNIASNTLDLKYLKQLILLFHLH